MEYAVMRRQNGSEHTVFEGVAALRALDAAQCCTECGATKPDGAQGWAAGFTRTQRTRTAGITKRLRVMCGACLRVEDASRRGLTLPADRRGRLAQAERQLATLPSSRRGSATTMAARRQRLKQAEAALRAQRRGR